MADPSRVTQAQQTEKPPIVLIVDELPSIIRLLELELSIQGFETAGCQIGDQTFQAIEELEPNVVVLEILLPGMDGFDLLKELKQRYTMPVLILTTIDSEADRALAFELGADDYVTKPFDPYELGQRLSALVGRLPRELRFFHAGEVYIDLTRQLVKRGSQVISLTTNEWATLLSLSLHPQQYVAASFLLESVAGSDSAQHPELLSPVIRRLRETLEEDPASPQRLKGDLQQGFMLDVEIETAE